MMRSLALAALLATFLPEVSYARKACTFEYKPVCACKGGNCRTYGNDCVAEADNARIIRRGPCPDDETGRTKQNRRENGPDTLSGPLPDRRQ